MMDSPKDKSFALICVISNYGQGSKLMHEAKRCGVTGGTILFGKGTANNRILEFLGLSDIRKEIVLIVAENNLAYQTIEHLNNKFEFEKPNHGIAFVTSICFAAGTRLIKGDNYNCKRGVDDTMYHFITAIVEKGRAEDVIDAATKAGSKGGTIINGRGSGIHETSKLFSMDIEPEKEIVMILSEAELTEAIVNSIRESLKIDEAGNGIIYVQNVNKTYGLYK
ncbi:MAG TPA: transcriptional regulator [Ruminococcaceae bacterium]|jgi:nitrogen regulatory protein PII|nr:transcriptional regulator [Oscillospiraceae bacterium]HCA28811.1 transcriptional regulator [Oscillospiraceae bacterium]